MISSSEKTGSLRAKYFLKLSLLTKPSRTHSPIKVSLSISIKPRDISSLEVFPIRNSVPLRIVIETSDAEVSGTNSDQSPAFQVTSSLATQICPSAGSTALSFRSKGPSSIFFSSSCPCCSKEVFTFSFVSSASNLNFLPTFFTVKPGYLDPTGSSKQNILQLSA